MKIRVVKPYSKTTQQVGAAQWVSPFYHQKDTVEINVEKFHAFIDKIHQSKKGTVSGLICITPSNIVKDLEQFIMAEMEITQ